MIKIDDPDDPRIEPYLAVRDRDLAGRGGCFVAEGEVVVRLLLSGSSRFAARSLLVAADRVEPLGALLCSAPSGLPVYVASRSVMSAIVGFPIHRGVLAIGSRGDPSPPVELIRSVGAPAIVLGLVGIANHDNVGGAFRNAAAFGADAVLLDGTSCDPLYRKAIRVSVGASLVVPYARASSAETLVETVRLQGFEVVALSPGGAERIEDVAWPARTTILVGSEGAGLPDAILSALRTIRIPMAAGFDSLNVATAAGIALHACRTVHRSRQPSLTD